MHAELPAGPGRRSWLRAVLAAVVVGVLSAGSASPALGEDTCANATARAQNNSTHLPDCRAYEMVSPPYKQGFPVRLVGLTDDGLVAYSTQGSFAGNMQGALFTIDYHALRSATGWTSAPLAPAATSWLGLDDYYVDLRIESLDLRWSAWPMRRSDVSGDKLGFWVRGPDGAFTRIDEAIDSLGLSFIVSASSDLSHVVFQHGSAGDPLATALWEVVSGGNGRRAVSVDNQGQQSSSVETCPNDVSADGRVIVFTWGCHDTGALRVMARVGGSATVAVSGSECTRSVNDPGGSCNGVSAAEYAGGAADGSRVFVTTSQQLVNGDIDATNDLYACDIPAGVPAPVGTENPCASLTQISGTASNAQVENVVAVSEDGSQAYFVAKGVLASNLGVGDVGARAGNSNLYLWERDGAHPAGQTRFVARLEPNDLARAQMTPDNRYLLFQTAGSLVTEGPGADTDGGATDVYRYDATTEAMVRVSTSVAGGGGNDPAFNAGIGEKLSMTASTSSMTSRISSMTSDGSTVIFDTAEPLSAGEANGVRDVYAWRAGQVSLISAGGVDLATGGGSSVARISPSGRDIFFTTNAPVLDADRDVITDIYDARVGGGFERAPTPSPCSGDECQGQRSQPPGLAGPSDPGLGDREPVVTPPTFSVRAVNVAQRRVLAATGKANLTVSANTAGTVRISASATVGGRSVTVGSARRILTAAGRVTVPLTLSKRARAQLAARGRLTVKVVVSHSKVALDRSVTLRLVRAKAKKSAKRAVSAQQSVSGADAGRSRR